MTYGIFKRICIFAVLFLFQIPGSAHAFAKEAFCRDIAFLHVTTLEAERGIFTASTEKLLMTMLRVASDIVDLQKNNPDLKINNIDYSTVISKIDAAGRLRKQNPESAQKLLVRHLAVFESMILPVERMLGCKEITKPEFNTSNTIVKPDLFAALKPETKTETVDKAILVYSTSGIGMIIALYVIFVVLLKLDRSPRYLCNTATLVVVNDKCTFTNIVDINRSGAKIEAALRHGRTNSKKDVWADVYFCGHKVVGRLVWENQYFAGVLFRKKISTKMVQDVLDANRKQLKDTGLVNNARSCFKLGCHEGCPKYMPTNISQTQDRVE